MRARILKPGFFDNEDLAECEPMARLLFAGLTLYCDRDGKFEWRPKRIRAKIFPYEVRCDIGKLLAQIQTPRLIVQYSVNGKQYGIIPKFLDHQNPHPNEKKSTLPDPPENLLSLNAITLPEMSLNANDVSIPISISIKDLCSSSKEAAQLLKDLLLREQPNAKTPKDLITGKRSWAAEIDRMIRIDKRDPPQILKMIRWLYNENLQNEVQFVVKSAQSLRKKYDRIETQMKKHEPKRAEDPHKNVKCVRCQSWWSTMERNEEGLCENCQRETLS